MQEMHDGYEPSAILQGLRYRPWRIEPCGARDGPTEAFADQVRHFKLAHTVETRNTCTYCSVGCGLIMQPGRRRQERRAEHHPYRGRRRPSGQPRHPLPESAGLLDYIHSPNRLKYPEVREAGSSEWKRIEWDEALERIAKLMKEDRDANFVEKNEQGQTVNRWLTTGFLAASASSNEAGYITHKVMRPRHPGIRQPGACLTRPDGGKSCPDVWPWSHDQPLDRHQECRSGADHGRQRRRSPPCGFKWVTEAKAHNKARLLVVDPRFTRSASVADYYAPIRTGTDIAFLGGLINYLLENDKIQHEYVRNYTDVSFIVKEGFGFEDGLFNGYDAEKRTYPDKSSWGYEIGEDGYAKVDPTLTHPRCVFNLLKQHYSRYTPDVVSNICGTPKDMMLKVWAEIAETSKPGKVMTIMYALGWTQHSVGAQMIRTGAMVQLLLGNIGMPGGGMNALRGHSNIQGLTDLGLLSNSLPGYLTPGDGRRAGLRRLHRQAHGQAAARDSCPTGRTTASSTSA